MTAAALEPDFQAAAAISSKRLTGRRAFIKSSLLGAGSFTIGLHLPTALANNAVTEAQKLSLKPNAWVEIPPQGRIRFICGRSEMGQGTATGLAMLLCEELEVPLQDIDLVLAPASRDYDHVDYLLQTTGLAADKIKVNCTFMGGGFGRRLEADFVVEAIEIARAFRGRQAVKMIWSRESDMRAGMYRPGAVARLRGSYDKSSKQLQWQQVIATPSVMERQGPDFMQGIAPHWVSAGAARGVGKVVSWFIDGMTIKEGVVPPYQLEALDVTWQKTRTPLSMASWRSVGHSHNAFFIESFADELAHSQQQDAMEFRLQTLADKQPRLKQTLKAAVIFGLTAALYGEITVEKGAVQQSNFHDYPLLRSEEAPQVHAIIVPSWQAPGGVGEPAVPLVVPALVNAIFATTGVRRRRLPLIKTET